MGTLANKCCEYGPEDFKNSVMLEIFTRQEFLPPMANVINVTERREERGERGE